MRIAIRVVLVGAVALATGTPYAAGGDDAAGEVPYLFGLASHWKARFDSRIEPTLLAIDPARRLPREEPQSSEGPKQPGPWAIHVTDVLEITASDDFPARLDAFAKRLDDPAAQHADFVVKHSWIGTGTSDGDEFAPALDRVRGSRVVFAWGRHENETDRPFHLDYDHNRGGGLGIPLLSVERSDLTAFAGDVRTYLRLLTASRVPADLWREIRALPHEEIRYAAVRDVIDASYGFGRNLVPGRIGGLTDAPIGVREAFARDLWAAAGDSPRRRLQAIHLLDHQDHDPEVRAALLGDDFRWLLDLVSGEEPLAGHALGVAASKEGAPVARAIGVDMIFAAIDRPRGVRYGIEMLERILAAAPPLERVSVDRVRSLLRSVTGSDGRDWTAWVSKEHAAKLLVALARTMPQIRAQFASIPEVEREAVKRWLRSLRVWAPPLEEPIREARALFGE